jgi:hypothetical protein
MKDMSTRLVYIRRLQMEASKAENNKAAIPQRIPIRLWIVPSFEKTARPHGHKTDIEVSRSFSSQNQVRMNLELCEPYQSRMFSVKQRERGK